MESILATLMSDSDSLILQSLNSCSIFHIDFEKMVRQVPASQIHTTGPVYIIDLVHLFSLHICFLDLNHTKPTLFLPLNGN